MCLANRLRIVTAGPWTSEPVFFASIGSVSAIDFQRDLHEHAPSVSRVRQVLTASLVRSISFEACREAYNCNRQCLDSQYDQHHVLQC
jgi:hypothetical protein